MFVTFFFCSIMLQVKLSKSHCFGKKFLTVIKALPMEKKNDTTNLGFRGLFQLACKELRYEPITQIIANYDLGYYHLHMATKIVVLVTPKYVSEVIGILDNGVNIVVYNRISTKNCIYNLQILEDKLHNLLIGDNFKKSFLIFAYATILVPNSKLEGMHDLEDTIWDTDVAIGKNWAKFILQFVEDGMREYHNSHPTYIRGCMLFLQVPRLLPFHTI